MVKPGRILVKTTVGVGLFVAPVWLAGVDISWRGMAIALCLALCVNVWIEHRREVHRAQAMATAPPIIDPATEVSPGETMVALVMAVNARPWWAPWRPCHSDHVTLAETTLDRSLVGQVRVGLAHDRFVVLDDLGALLEFHGWREHFRPGSTVTAVVRTR